MVIHDLKHPTDSIISQLSFLQSQLQAHVESLETLHTSGSEIQSIAQE